MQSEEDITSSGSVSSRNRLRQPVTLECDWEEPFRAMETLEIEEYDQICQ